MAELTLYVLAAEFCKKMKQEQVQMRDEAEQLNSEIKSLEADVRYTLYVHCLYTPYILAVSEILHFGILNLTE